MVITSRRAGLARTPDVHHRPRRRCPLVVGVTAVDFRSYFSGCQLLRASPREVRRLRDLEAVQTGTRRASLVGSTRSHETGFIIVGCIAGVLGLLWCCLAFRRARAKQKALQAERFAHVQVGPGPRRRGGRARRRPPRPGVPEVAPLRRPPAELRRARRDADDLASALHSVRCDARPLRALRPTGPAEARLQLRRVDAVLPGELVVRPGPRPLHQQAHRPPPRRQGPVVVRSRRKH